jgi:hypothetical protein
MSNHPSGKGQDDSIQLEASAGVRKSALSSPEDLARGVVERRAIEAMIWGMSLVNFDLMYQAMVRATKARDNQVVYWSRPIDWKCQLLTPNTDLIYMLPFFDTSEVGPVVVEIPPADGGVINGSLMDAWQTPLEDVGPAGVDKGKGAKYLVLPPGYKENPPEGYIVLRSATYKGYGLMRSLLPDGSDAGIAKAAAYGRCIQVYPLAKAASPPPTFYADANDILFDANIQYDSRFFDSLNRMVQTEPWLERDRAMINMLKSLGIEKGKPYNPDAEARKLLDAAAAQAHAFLDAGFDATFTPPWHSSSRWAFLTSQAFTKAVQSNYADPDVYPTDDRGVLYTFIFFAPKRLVEGQFYLMTHRDKAGKVFDGGRNYRLTVPPNVPARQYWSATVYDRETHGLVRNMSHAARSSQTPGLNTNADGSVDLFFGPKAPNGREANWVPTDPKRRFEVLFRFYGTEKRLFEKTWVLPDVEEVK